MEISVKNCTIDLKKNNLYDKQERVAHFHSNQPKRVTTQKDKFGSHQRFVSSTGNIEVLLSHIH